MKDLAAPFNRDLYGFTEIVSIEILRDEESRDYPTRNLRLLLENSKKERMELWCMEVCDLKLNNIYQISFLQAEDVRLQQLDRVTLKFSDQEMYEDISFSCFAAKINKLQS